MTDKWIIVRICGPSFPTPYMCNRILATQEEIASTLGITSRQLRTWRAQYPELRQAMDAGNEVFDTRVERALAERATGFYERLCSVSVQLSVNLSAAFHHDHAIPGRDCQVGTSINVMVCLSLFESPAQPVKSLIQSVRLQGRTPQHVRVMSALPPKADIAWGNWQVRFVLLCRARAADCRGSHANHVSGAPTRPWR